MTVLLPTRYGFPVRLVSQPDGYHGCEWKRILESKTWETEKGTHRKTLKREGRKRVCVCVCVCVCISSHKEAKAEMLGQREDQAEMGEHKMCRDKQCSGEPHPKSKPL